MKRLEALTIAAALTLGGVTGFVLARQASSSKNAPLRQDAGLFLNGTVGKSAAAEGEVAARLGAHDPLDAILSESSSTQRLVKLDAYCASLDADDARQALREHPAEDSAKNHELRSRLLSRWAELDPMSAAQFASGIKDPDERGGALIGVLEVWIAQDVEGAEKFVTALNTVGEADDLLFTFVGQLADHDPEQALAFASKIPSKPDSQLGRAAFYTLAQRDPVAAIARAAALPVGIVRGDAIDATIGVWVEKDAPAAMAWVMRHPDTPISFGRTLLDSVLDRWADKDPAAAARFAQKLPKEQRSRSSLPNLASSWASHDVPAALRWAQALPDGDDKSKALSSIAYRWAYTDPAAAIQFTAQGTPGEQRDQQLERIGTQWAERDAVGALAWAQRQSGTLREKLVPAALAKLAEDDPDAATAQLATLKEPAMRREAIKQIAADLAKREPQEATRWLLELPAADADDAALKAAMYGGTQRDPAAMGSLLNELAQHPRRETMVAAFVETAGWNNPEEALVWAATLKDTAQRTKMMRETVRRFAWYNSDSARAWVLKNQADPAEQKAMLGVVEKTTKRR